MVDYRICFVTFNVAAFEITIMIIYLAITHRAYDSINNRLIFKYVFRHAVLVFQMISFSATR
jgi:hypothetical protein